MRCSMFYFRAWESLPEYGVSLFVVKFHGEKKEELLVSLKILGDNNFKERNFIGDIHTFLRALGTIRS